MAKFAIDGDLVRQLAALLDETGLGEIEYEAEGRRLRVAKPAVNSVAPIAAAAPPLAAPAGATAETAGAAGRLPRT